MVPALIAVAMSVGGFAYDVQTLFHRSKLVRMESGYEETWEEDVTAVKARSSRDAAFSRYMRARALMLQRQYYGGGVVGEQSFETASSGGSLDVSETVAAASPDVVCVKLESSSYGTGAAHPNVESAASVNWSRRFQRPLTQRDVFARPPDAALRRLALRRFSNRTVITDKDPDGLPLDWDSACIGPKGITWSFAPYSFGGYLSGGEATVSWSDLKPYIRARLPFAVNAIRAPTADK